jgi:hypothetical protein
LKIVTGFEAGKQAVDIGSELPTVVGTIVADKYITKSGVLATVKCLTTRGMLC